MRFRSVWSKCACLAMVSSLCNDPTTYFAP